MESQLWNPPFEVSGRFEREMRKLLQKPFYFQLVVSGAVVLPTEAHPRDFYKAFFGRLTDSFQERFGVVFDLEYALSLSAFEAIDHGEEAQPLSDLLHVLQGQLKGAALGEIHASDVANWLVSNSVLIPYRGARLAFFHQSATEYLVASELARRYERNAQALKERLRLTRWDQALFLTLSLLPKSHSADFLQTVIDTDFALALNATKYLESNRDEIVAKLLSEIPARIAAFGRRGGFQIESAVEFGLEVSDVHEPQLRSLMKYGNMIGAAAVIRLVELKGISVKEELLQAFVDARDDYNYCCNGVARALLPFATPEDAYKIVALADSMESEISPGSGDNVAIGLTSGAAMFLSGLDLSVIRDAFLPRENLGTLSEVRSRIVCDILQKHHSTEALDLAAELLLNGTNKAATAIYFIANFAKPPEHGLSWATFDREHVECLVSKANDEGDESWSLKALRLLCERRPDLAEMVRARALGAPCVMKAALLYCASSGDLAPVFEALTEFAGMDRDQRKGQPIHVFEQIELEWAGHELLLLQLLRLRDTQLALALLNETYNRGQTLSEVEIGPIAWWLDWLMEEWSTGSGDWFCYKMAWLFDSILSAGTPDAFVTEFNRGTSRFRRVLADFIFRRFSNLTTDVFSDDAVSFLLADLNRKGSVGFDGHLLGPTATEQFVTERLLPLVTDAQAPFSENLRRVLQHAGSRHGRRYVSA